MKCYCFLYNNNIYAYTFDKKVYRKFIETRNCSKFLLVKIDIEKSGYDIFKTQNKLFEIIEYSQYDNDKVINKDSIELILTLNELLTIKARGIEMMSKIAWETTNNNFILLKDKYINALAMIMYPHMTSSKSHDFQIKGMNFDALGCFIDKYKDLIIGFQSEEE